MKRALIIVIALVAVVAAAVFGWSWWARARASPAPPRTAVAVTSAPRSSTLTLPITASLDDLQARLEREVPLTWQELDERLEGCVPATFAKLGGRKTRLTAAIDCHLAGRITRGPLSIDGRGNVFRVTIPVSMRFTVRGRGEIGRHIEETADGALRVVASVVVGVAEDWAPSVKVSSDWDWQDPIGVTVLGARLTFAERVDPIIEKTLKALEADLPRQLQRLRLQEQAAAAWQRAHAVVAVDRDPDVWLRFTPQAIAFRSYDIRGRRFETTVTVTGASETFVGARPPSVAPTPLPPLSRDVSGSGFSFYLPVSIDYGVLERAAEEKLHKGRSQRVEVPGTGAVDVVVRRVTIHQSAPRGLAVGVTVEAGGALGLLDTRGTLWLIGQLAIDAASKKLIVTSLAVSAETDSALGPLLLLAESPELQTSLQQALAHDLSRDFDDGLAKANAAIAERELTGGVVLRARIDKVTAGPVVAGPTSLLTSLVADGVARLSVADPDRPEAGR